MTEKYFKHVVQQKKISCIHWSVHYETTYN